MNRKTSILLSMAISIVLIALAVWFLYNHNMNFGPTGGRWFMGHHGMMGGGMGIVMFLFWILIVGALVLFISAMVNGASGSGQYCNEANEPLNILKQRYARGEIDKADYEKMRREIST